MADTPTGPPADSNNVANGADAQVDKEKRVVTLTAKAFVEKIERLQKDRRAKLNKASSLKRKIKELIQKGKKSQVQCAFNELLKVCDEAKSVQDSVISMLPEVEQEKHDVWFKAQMLNITECITQVQLWVSSVEQNVLNSGEQNVSDYDDDDGINPDDSISNVGSQHSSRKSACSSGSSTTSSARVIIEADKAALLVRMAALKERHALEEQEQQIRRKKEQHELETMLAESAAKLAVLQASDSRSKVSNAMNSYLERETRNMEPVNRLDPLAKEFNLIPPSRPQRTQQLSLSAANNPLTAIRPSQGANQHLATRPKEWTNSNSHRTLERETLMSTLARSRPNTQPTD